MTIEPIVVLLLVVYSAAATVIAGTFAWGFKSSMRQTRDALKGWAADSDFMFASYVALLKRHEPEHAEFCLRKVAEFTVKARLADISGGKS